MIPLLFGLVDDASALTKSVTLCVMIDVNYQDAEGLVAVGDWFDDNDEHQPFRGGRVQITDNNGPRRWTLTGARRSTSPSSTPPRTTR